MSKAAEPLIAGAGGGVRWLVLACTAWFVVVAAGYSPSSRGTVSTAECASLDARGANVLAYIDRIATSLDQEAQTWRDSLPLAHTTSDSVYHVTTDSVCAAAAAALDELFEQAPHSRPVFVYAVGSVYAVVDRALPLGEFTRITFFTRDWEYVAGIGGG